MSRRDDEEGVGVPEAIPLALRLLERELGAPAMDRLWIFPALIRGRKERGLIAVSCFTGGEPEGPTGSSGGAAPGDPAAEESGDTAAGESGDTAAGEPGDTAAGESGNTVAAPPGETVAAESGESVATGDPTGTETRRSLAAEPGERRHLHTVAWTAERTGKGLDFEPVFREEGSAPQDRLPRVIEGVVRRSGLDSGSPREIRIAGDPLVLDALLSEFDLPEESPT